MDESGDREEREEEDEEDEYAETEYSEVPLILPRRSFKGVSNLQTIKDGTVFVAWPGSLVADDWIDCSQLRRTK